MDESPAQRVNPSGKYLLDPSPLHVPHLLRYLDHRNATGLFDLRRTDCFAAPRDRRIQNITISLRPAYYPKPLGLMHRV
jgi:hypothetical protein